MDAEEERILPLRPGFCAGSPASENGDPAACRSASYPAEIPLFAEKETRAVDMADLAAEDGSSRCNEIND